MWCNSSETKPRPIPKRCKISHILPYESIRHYPWLLRTDMLTWMLHINVNHKSRIAPKVSTNFDHERMRYDDQYEYFFLPFHQKCHTAAHQIRLWVSQ